MPEKKNQSYLKGAAILAATVAIVKVIGAIYKIPLYNLLGDEGTSYFNVTYSIYNLMLTISTAGIPVALSRLVSAANATGRLNQVKRYYGTSMPAFIIIGTICMLIMIVFPKQLAGSVGNEEAAAGIVALAPAILFCCIVAVYRGYFQGFENMMPTAVSQILEVLCKLVFGLGLAAILLRSGYEKPIISAGAIMGVSIGMFMSAVIMFVYKKRHDIIMRPKYLTATDRPMSRAGTLGLIFSVSVPIMLSVSIMHIIYLLDTRIIYSQLQSGAGMSYEMAKILNGVLAKAHTLFNLPSAFIVPITTSVVPAIAAALANRRHGDANKIMESSLKLTNLLGMPMGVGLTVLSYPIFNLLYWDSNEIGPTLLAYLGIASYFVCLQLMTAAILQASGHEKITMLTLPAGGVAKVIVSWFLVGVPSINVVGAPIGTLISYIVIAMLDLSLIMVKVPGRPSIRRTFLKPILCSAVMGAAAWAVYGLSSILISRFMEWGRFTIAICTVISIGVAVIIYAVLIIATGTITKEDMSLMPKGDKIAKLLKLH